MTQEQGTSPDTTEQDTRIVDMRDGGATWKEIEGAFGLTRQQARYAYQRGKRVERRKAKRERNNSG